MSLLTQEREYLEANPGKTRSDFIAWANETVYTLTPGKPCGYGTIRDRLGKELADGITAYLKATDENASFLFLAGNVDFGLASTQAMLDTIKLPGVPDEVIDVLRDLGRVASVRIAGVTQEALEQADADTARETKQAAWAALINDELWPNIADVLVPTAEEFRIFIGK